MEFDLGNILYIVVTIVAIAASLLRKKKKPAGKGKEGARPGFMENLEQFLSQGQAEPAVMDLGDDEADLPDEESLMPMGEKEDGVFDIESKALGLSSEYADILERLSSREGEFSYGEGEVMTEALEIISLEDEDEGADYFEIVKDFDAGTAVVYSAIINRVEY